MLCAGTREQEAGQRTELPRLEPKGEEPQKPRSLTLRISGSGKGRSEAGPGTSQGPSRRLWRAQGVRYPGGNLTRRKRDRCTFLCPEPKRSKCPGCRNSRPTALGVASDRDRGSLVTPRRTGLLTPRWSPLREVVPLLCARLCCGPALATVGSWEPRPESGLKRRSLRKQVPFRPLHWGPWSFFDHDPYRETRRVSVHTHVYTHSHTYTCTHTYKHARTHTSPRLDTLAYTHVHTHKYTQVHTIT